MTKFQIEADLTACQGFGACIELCSIFFEFSNREGKVHIKGGREVKEGNRVVRETLELSNLKCVREAAEACPFNVIQIKDLETGEKVI
jgi:ferredoxin